MIKRSRNSAVVAACIASGLLLGGCVTISPETVDAVEDLVGSAVATPSSASSPSASPEATSVESSQSSPAEETEDKAERAEAEEKPAAEVKWTTAATLSGKANKQSDTLSLPGGKVRLTYDFVDSSGHGMIVAAVYLLEEGTDLHSDGGIPEVTITEEGKGETLLRKSAGDYFIYVMAANTDFTVTLDVQE